MLILVMVVGTRRVVVLKLTTVLVKIRVVSSSEIAVVVISRVVGTKETAVVVKLRMAVLITVTGTLIKLVEILVWTTVLAGSVVVMVEMRVVPDWVTVVVVVEICGGNCVVIYAVLIEVDIDTVVMVWS